MSPPPGGGAALLAYDGSDGANDAMTFAGRVLAPREAIVVTAWTGLTDIVLRPKLYAPGGPLAEAREEIDSVEAKAGLELAEAGAALARESGFGAAEALARHRHRGRVWEAVLDAAREHDPAVVVAGARGRGPIASTLLGSTSHGLAAHSPYPVLIAHWNPKRPRPQGPAMICHDGSDCSRRAVEVAGELLAPGDDTLVAHVSFSYLAHSNVYVPIVHREVQQMARELDDQELASARERSEAGAGLAREAGFRGVRTEARLTGVTQASELAHIAHEADASLIVMGTHGMSGIGAALGSVAAGVLHRLNRPVLVVPGDR